MAEFLAWLEGSGLGRAMRGTGVWTYALVNLAHILGIGALSGAVLLLDLRLLGIWRSVPLAALSRPASQVAGVGLAVALATGVALLATKATEYAGNPFFWWVKLPGIGLALGNLLALSRQREWQEHGKRELTAGEERRLAWFGGVSLLGWGMAMVGGRLTAYW